MVVDCVTFDRAPLGRRGYNEDQVDDFLDAVVATLELRERTIRTPPLVFRPAPTEQPTPMPFAQPPSLPADDPIPTTQPLRDRDPDDDLDTDAATHSVGPDDLLALPLPPPPPGSRGYRAGDVEKLAKLLAAAIEQVDGPSANDVARFKLNRTFFTGQGYHTGVVDVLIQAWLDELRNREAQ
jgi:DivIVA domain-containing protein